MNAHSVLTGLLVAQCVFAAITWYPSGGAPATRPVVPFERGAITKIQLESATTRSRGSDLVLARDGSDWTVQSEHNFPAKSKPIEELLDRLVGLKLGRPMSTDPAMHGKLNVSDTTPTRRMTVYAGDESREFLVGTGSRELAHIRHPGEDEVYQTYGMGAWRLSDTSSNYLQKEALQIQRDELAALSLTNANGTISLLRTGDVWMLDTGEATRPIPVNDLLRRAVWLTVSKPADTAAPDPRAAPEVVVTWKLADGTGGRYDARSYDGGFIVRMGDDRLPVFHVSKVDPMPQLLGADVQDLIDTASVPEAPE